jgi:hypothetical protein
MRSRHARTLPALSGSTQVHDRGGQPPGSRA